MKTGQYIKKAVSIPLYLIVIYYLLPFRPMYLYYSAYHHPSTFLNELKKEKEFRNNLTGTKQLSQNNDTFPQKDKVRFFFKAGLIITPAHSNSFVFISKDEIRFIQYPSYQSPLILFNAVRGPPIA